MIKTSYKKSFKKAYVKLDKKRKESLKERTAIFLKEPHNRNLYNHRLGGNLRGLFSFSVDGDFRVWYTIIKGSFRKPEEVVFVNIGTHNQLYG